MSQLINFHVSVNKTSIKMQYKLQDYYQIDQISESKKDLSNAQFSLREYIFCIKVTV